MYLHRLARRFGYDQVRWPDELVVVRAILLCAVLAVLLGYYTLKDM
jgi:hypothetical protein